MKKFSDSQDSLENGVESNTGTFIKEMRKRLQSRSTERLGLYELILAAQERKDLEAATHATFVKRYGQSTFTIFGPLTDNLTSIVETLESVKGDHIVEKLLSTFGMHITKLEIDYTQLERFERRQVHKWINDNCAKSLNSLSLIGWDRNLLRSMQNPFTEMKNLRLSGDLRTPRIWYCVTCLFNWVSLDKSFPNITRLTLDEVREYDDDVLDVKFPELTYVKVNFLKGPFDGPSKNYLPKTKELLRTLFSNNPQIKHLVFRQCNSIDFIKIAAEMLPNLEVFQVDIVQLEERYDGGKIHFGKLKKLLMWWITYKMSDFIRIDSLDELYITCPTPDCKAFIENNHYLRKLFVVGKTLQPADIKKFYDDLPDLQRMTIITKTALDKKALTQYFEEKKKCFEFSVEILEELYGRMDQETEDKLFEH